MKKFKSKLLNLLKKDTKPKVVAIKGEWGSGKSTFWKKFVKEESYNNAYISLYGLNSIKDIENSILLQISELNVMEDFVERKLKFLHDIQILGVNAKAVLSSLKPSTFKKLVICLDDFERLSNKISVNELFGFIADLKENRECRVVIILNEEKIPQKNREDFDIQKEKVIDYELFFKTDLNNINNIDKVNSLYKEYLFDFVKKFEVQNIRTINKMIFFLDDFISKLGDNSFDTKVMKNIFQKMIEASFVYYQFNFKDFELFQEYKNKQVSDTWHNILKEKNQLKTDEKTILEVEKTKKFLDKNKELQIYKKYLENFKFENLEKHIIGFITKHEFDINFVNDYIENEKYNLNHNDLRSQINNIIDKSKYDFNYPLEKYDSDFFSFLSKYKKKILKLKNLETIKMEIEKCKKISKNDYDSLLIEMQKSYLKDYRYIDFHGNINHDTNYDQIIKENNQEIMEYLESLIKYNKNPTAKEIIEIFEKAINTQKVTPISEENTVNKLSEVKIKEFILSNQEFVKIVFDDFNRHNNFLEFKEKLTNVFDDLKSDEKYRFKIKNLME